MTALLQSTLDHRPRGRRLWAAASLCARDAAWLTADRVQAYAKLFSALFVVLALAWVGLSHDGIDITGKPLGTDFNSFWTASKLALSEPAIAVYDTARHRAAQSWGGRPVESYAAFFYPPVFLLICLPLALVPYGVSLLLWLGATGAAYGHAVRRFGGGNLGLLPVLAFPAVWINIGHGQNGFLSAALLGGGALLVNARPVLAGVCFGALAYKPHLALAIPVALMAARRWETFLAAAGTALGLCLVSYGAFGAATWQAFFDQSAIARAALEQGLVGDAKMQSLFAAIRLWGGSLSLAYGLQALLGLAVCAALVGLHRRAFRSSAEGPAMIAASLLLSPFLLDYDLTLLALPLAWLLAAGIRDGFLPYEKTVLALAFMLPLVSRTLASGAGIPLAPFVLAAVFTLVLRRGMMSGQQSFSAPPAIYPRPR
jgi:alpha-1,2-mannosyltransferase